MAKDNGRTDYWAPDSTLESNKPGVYYQAADGSWFNVCINDFVDISALVPDPIWGSSFQIVDLVPGQVVVRFYDPIADLYNPTNVDVSLINQNYQLSPFLDSLPDGAVTL